MIETSNHLDAARDEGVSSSLARMVADRGCTRSACQGWMDLKLAVTA